MVSALVNVTIDGIAYGMILALLGVSITLVFGLGDVLNLAIGAFSVIAVIVAVEAAAIVSNPVFGGVVGLAAILLIGGVIDRTLLTSIYKSEGEERILLGIFVTLGLTILIEGLLFVYYPEGYLLPLGLPLVSVGIAEIQGSTIVQIVVPTLVLGALFYFLRRSRTGKATKTVIQDEVGAMLCGINPRRIQALVFLVSALLAGLAGIMIATSSEVTATTGFELTVFGIIVSIVGGIRNVRGAVVSGLLLGLVVTYAGYFIGGYVSNLIMFLLAVVILLVKPEGLQ